MNCEFNFTLTDAGKIVSGFIDKNTRHIVIKWYVISKKLSRMVHFSYNEETLIKLSKHQLKDECIEHCKLVGELTPL